MVTDFMDLGDDVVNQGRVGQAIQEEGRFDVQQRQIRQYLAEVGSTGNITDGQGNDLLIGVDLIDQLRRYRDDRRIRVYRINRIDWVHRVYRINRIRIDALESQQACDRSEFITKRTCCCDHLQQSCRCSGR
ncbi:hypothetical protein SDC9_116154 [bioreactor metagenome]|uniref:Uncharacterized protein n=1 Tax=bioreactor metagenome TaxID=1076179 RepID=A0A645BUT6_9ZZZZ